jgi:hypothetical protein
MNPQTPMDWVQIGTTFGVPLLLLAWVAWFVNAKVWPFVEKRIEASDKERAAERDAFLASLNDIKTTLHSNTAATLEVLKEIRRDDRRRERGAS